MKKIHKNSKSLIIEISETEQIDYCDVRSFIEIIGGKWKFLIYYQLIVKPRRYIHLMEAMPQASEKMILTSLRELEEYKIVERIIYNETPQRVEYKVT
jgi:DNA-binding HxlR family transcriptional regulator